MPHSMTIRPEDVHPDLECARHGVERAAGALDIKCNLAMKTLWILKLDPADLKAFLEIARDLANEK